MIQGPGSRMHTLLLCTNTADGQERLAPPYSTTPLTTERGWRHADHHYGEKQDRLAPPCSMARLLSAARATRTAAHTGTEALLNRSKTNAGQNHTRDDAGHSPWRGGMPNSRRNDRGDSNGGEQMPGTLDEGRTFHGEVGATVGVAGTSESTSVAASNSAVHVCVGPGSCDEARGDKPGNVGVRTWEQPTPSSREAPTLGAIDKGELDERL